MYFVYILYSRKFDRYYIGQTNNLENRLIRHNNGYVKSTKNFKPWEIVYYESFDSRAESMYREKYLKSLKSKVAIQKLIADSRNYLK